MSDTQQQPNAIEPEGSYRKTKVVDDATDTEAHRFRGGSHPRATEPAPGEPDAGGKFPRTADDADTTGHERR
jgi:hypothetical protein